MDFFLLRKIFSEFYGGDRVFFTNILINSLFPVFDLPAD